LTKKPATAEAPRPLEPVQVIEQPGTAPRIPGDCEIIAQPSAGILEGAIDAGIGTTDRLSVGIELVLFGLSMVSVMTRVGDAGDGHAAVLCAVLPEYL